MFEDILKYSSHILRESKKGILLSSQGLSGKLYILKTIFKKSPQNFQDPILKRSKTQELTWCFSLHLAVASISLGK